MSDQALPAPRLLTPNFEDASLVQSFLHLFRVRSPHVPANLPTACALVSGQSADFTQVQQLAGAAGLLVYWDAGSKLRRSSIDEVEGFLATREPWEDYDFCIFPGNLAWCAGFTHDDRWFISTPDRTNVFQSA